MTAEQLALFDTCAESCHHPDTLLERDRWGRPVIDGVSHVRISTLASTLDDNMGLIAWKARQTLLGATPTTLRQAKVHAHDKAALDGLVEEATQRAGSFDAATEGTMMHAHLARYALDPDAFDWGGLDEAQAESVRAFSDVLLQAGLTAFMAEQFVRRSPDDHGLPFAGTFDLGLRDRHGGAWLADIKTGAKMWDRQRPLKVATQLAAYARGRRWCPVHGALPTPAWVGLLLVSVPLDAGACYIDVVDRTMADHALDLALTVRAERSRKAWLRPISV